MTPSFPKVFYPSLDSEDPRQKSGIYNKEVFNSQPWGLGPIQQPKGKDDFQKVGGDSRKLTPYSSFGSGTHCAKTIPLPVFGDLKKPPFSTSVTRVHNQKELFGQLDRLGTGQYALVMFSADWCGACTKYLPTFQRLARKYGGELLMIEAYGKNGSEEDWHRFGMYAFPTLAFLDRDKKITMVDQYHYEDPMLSHPRKNSTTLPSYAPKGPIHPQSENSKDSLLPFDRQDIQKLASEKQFFTGVLPLLRMGFKSKRGNSLRFKWSDPESGRRFIQNPNNGENVAQFQHVLDTDSNPNNGRIYMVDTFLFQGFRMMDPDRSFFYKKGDRPPRRINNNSGKYQEMGKKTRGEAFHFINIWLGHDEEKGNKLFF